MKRQIVNTGGQGLASSQAAKAALGAIVVAIVVLLIFFFLARATTTGDRAVGVLNAPACAACSTPRAT